MGLIQKILLILSLGAQLQTANLAHYSPGLMQKVSRNRHLPIVSCMISSPRHKIGDWVEIYGKNTNKKLRCRVTDTSAPKDKARHLKNKLIESDYWSAYLLCGSTKLSNKECPILIR